MASENTEQRTRVTRSLLRARAVQLGMLPDAPVLPELEIGVHYEACDELGGDFYDFIQVTPTELGIVLADVSGHGLDAALMMAAAKKTLQIHGRRNPSPAEVLKISCEDLATDLPAGSFVTVWYGVVNLQTGLLRYASAGHNPFLRRLPNGEITSHTSAGVVLGSAFVNVMRDRLKEETLQLTPGDWLLFYTDGVSEAADHNDEQFGTDRLNESFANAPTGSAIEVLQSVQMDVETFRAGRETDDDVTMLALRFRGVSEPELEPVWQPHIESNLPARSNSFIGREEEMLAIGAALEEGHSVIPIVGVAGLGKTRLALEAAREVANDYVGGTWFVALDNCVDVASVVGAVAGELGLGGLGADPAAALANALELRGPTLLVLDNAETCIEALRSVLEHLRRDAPSTRCIVTSQLRLGLSDEHEIEIKPLASPGSAFRNVSFEDAIDFASVGLLIDRAQRVKPDFKLTAENVQPVLGICAELEGMPLAIELAASRLGQLTPGEVFRQLRTPTNKIAMLRAQAGESALPYRSMREALEWSYAHLEDWEQACFRQMCAFRGGFFLEAAEEVVIVPRGDANRSVIEAIDNLLHKSFLRRESTPYGTRFNTYSSLRDFASRLTQQGENDDFEKRHIAFFVKYASVWNDARSSRKLVEATERIALDADNIRNAMRVAMDRGDLKSAMRLFDALYHCRDQRGSGNIRPLVNEFWELRDRLSDIDRVLVIQMKAADELTGGNAQDALLHATQAVDFAEEKNLTTALISSLMMRGRAAGNMGNEQRGLEDFERVIEIAQRTGNERNVGVAQISIANIASRQNRFGDAERMFREANQLLESLGDLHQAHVANTNLIMLYLRQKRWDDAEGLIEQTRDITEQTGSREMSAMRELSLARLLEGKGQPESAIEHYMTALSLFQEAGHSINASVTRLDMGTLCLSVGDIDAAREAAAHVKRFASISRTQLLTMRLNRLLGLIEIEDGDFTKARNILAENDEQTSKRPEASLRLTNKALLALAEFKCGHLDKTMNLVIEALPQIESAKPAMPDVQFLATVLRARVLQAQGKQANATRFAAMARELAAANGYTQYSINYFERAGMELLDVPATPEEAIRIRVRCPLCAQRYMGSEGRIRSLRKCMKCGMSPFKPLKVHENEP